MEPTPCSLFPATAWTLVRRLHSGMEAPTADAALDSLCRAYWEPVRRYLKALGCPESDTADVTQEFFASFLRNGGFEKADPALARLRTFIKMAAGNFLVNHWRNKNAQRRGSGAEHATLDEAQEIAERGVADAAYDKDWAQMVFGRALTALEEGYRARGRGDFFDAIKSGLLRTGGIEDAPGVALALGVPESQVRVAVHRARQRLVEALRTEVAALVDGPGEVDAEVRYLVKAIAHSG